MALVWIVILVVVTVVNKVIIDRLIHKNSYILARVVATITTICAIILVYFLIKSLMPIVIERMNVFYNQ